MKILFVNACMRGEASRTLRLCRAFLDTLGECLPDAEIIEHDLRTMGLRSVTAETLAVKEPLCDAYSWDDPLIRPAKQLQEADAVLIGAPYWDLSFPSALKVWVENMYVRNLTFRYEEDKPIGLLSGREAVYIQTAGSPIGQNDWGAGYMRAVLNTLGIPSFTTVSAEGLDLTRNDPESIMRDAEARARQAARDAAARLSGR